MLFQYEGSCSSENNGRNDKVLILIQRAIECEDWELLYQPEFDIDEFNDEKIPDLQSEQKEIKNPKPLKVFKSLNDFFDEIQIRDQEKEKIRKTLELENEIESIFYI